MAERFILIPGRTSGQGCGISEGKFGESYQKEIGNLLVSLDDAKRLELGEGSRVRLTSPFGRVELPISVAKNDELPPGVLFIAYGDISSRLMGTPYMVGPG